MVHDSYLTIFKGDALRMDRNVRRSISLLFGDDSGNCTISGRKFGPHVPRSVEMQARACATLRSFVHGLAQRSQTSAV